MESLMMDAVATAAQAAAHAAPGPQDARARRPYEAPSLQAVGLGAVFADGEYVYSYDAADNTSDGLTGDSLFGS